MQKFFFLFAVCLLATGMMLAQSTSGQSQAAQPSDQGPSAQSAPQSTERGNSGSSTGSAGAASQSDTSTQRNATAPDREAGNGSTAQPDGSSPRTAQDQSQGANTRPASGSTWPWIIIGIIVLAAIISMLSRRRSEPTSRVDRVEHIERREDDDIRRAG